MRNVDKALIARLLAFFVFLMFSVNGDALLGRQLTTVMWLFAAIFAIYSALTYLREAHTPKDLPTSRIRSAAQGFVEIKGVAFAVDSLVMTPFSNQSVLWYAYIKEKRVRSKNQPSWKNVLTVICDNPVGLDDGTGKVIVFPKDLDNETLTRESRQAYEKTFLGMGIGPLYRHTEVVIRPGDPLYCVGELSLAKTNDSPWPSLPVVSYSKARDYGLISSLDESQVVAGLKRSAYFSAAVLLFGCYGMLSVVGLAPPLIVLFTDMIRFLIGLFI